MRNLYKRLAVSPTSSESELQDAIGSISDARLRKDAEVVLLNPARRKVYDQVYQVVLNIRELRARLQLNDAENWQGAVAVDFSIPHYMSSSLHGELIAKVEALSQAKKRAEFVDRAKEYFRVIGMFGALLGIVWILHIFDEGSSVSNTPRRTPTVGVPYRSQPPQPTFAEPEQPLPSSGEVRRFTQQTAVAPFEIKSSIGSHYLVKLEDAYSGEDVLTVFVRGGHTVQIEVPLGTYTVEYAAGTKWYGYTHRFGPRTAYNRADETFRFEQKGYQVKGYTITLYTVTHGNLDTYEIGPEDF